MSAHPSQAMNKSPKPATVLRFPKLTVIRPSAWRWYAPTSPVALPAMPPSLSAIDSRSSATSYPQFVAIWTNLIRWYPKKPAHHIVDHPIPTLATVSLGKAALRSAATMLKADLEPDLIRMASLTIAGQIVAGTAF